MTFSTFKRAEIMVAGIAVQVAAWEVLCDDDQLISALFDRLLRQHPVLTRTMVVVTALHLLNVLDRKGLRWIDPYKLAAKLR